MKIIQIIQKPQNRGAEIFACQMANYHEKNGHEVLIISIFNGKAQLPWNKKIYSLGGNKNLRYADFKAWKKLNKIVRNFEPDIIQANSGDTLKYTVLSKFFFRWTCPIIFRNASEIGKYLNSNIKIKINRFLFRYVNRVISVSEVSEKDFLNHFPFMKDRTEVIPVGLEFAEVPGGVQFSPSKAKHIAHVGGFSFEKNHKGLLRIFKKVLELNSNVYLHLIGDGPLRQQIESEINFLELEKNIKLYGFVDNPLSYIKAANVLVLPSIIEGLPGVLLESMYCKTPVISYNVGGVSEIVTPETGYLVKKNNESDFVSAILEVLEKPDLIQVEKANIMVHKNFQNKDLADKFLKVYSKLTPH